MAPPKAKGQKMALGEFLTDTSLGSWADEMEDAPIPCARSTSYGGDRSYTSGGTGGPGGTSSYADRGYSVREALPLPSKPPYTVHLGNMSFDATEGDIQDFFSGCQVNSVRIVEDRVERKPKGFGYAEFATIEGLKKALDLSGTQFQGRNIRISVAEPQKDRPEARELNDWTRKGPLPDIGGPKRVSEKPGFGDRGGFGRNNDSFVEAMGERGSRKNTYEQADGKVRDLGNWERKGPLTPTQPSNGPMAREPDRPSSHDGPRERKNSPAWGEGRSQAGSRPPRREFVERPVPVREPTAAETDNQWRLKMRPDPPAASTHTSRAPSVADVSTPTSPAPNAVAPQPAAPTMRPKLNLQKRTVSEAQPSPALSTGFADSRASPFGAARPIDTASREKEIEERLRQRKEQEEKAREEKRAAEEKVKEDRRVAKDAERVEKSEKAKDNDGEGPEEQSPGKSYQILRRAADEASEVENSEAQNADANGVVVDDKAVKPQEIIRETKAKGAPAEVPSEPTAKALEDDGWSMVSKANKPNKNRRSVNFAARAIAS